MSVASQLRQNRIVEMARASGRLDVAEVARELEVSSETLRRDLRALESAGLIRRSYGVVFPTEVGRYEVPMRLRPENDATEKAAIAAKTVEELAHASVIYLDEGTLPLLMLHHLPMERWLTIVTPSIPLATELASGRRHDVILLGGRLRPATLGTVDHWATDMLAAMMVDVAIMGANGIDAEHGVTTPDPAVSAVKAAAVRSARQAVLAIEHTKFGVVSFARFAGVRDFDVVVTGHQLRSSTTQRLQQMGTRVVRA